MTKDKSTFLQWLTDGALFVAVVGTLLFAAHYGMSLFYPAPAYEDFCDQPSVTAPVQDTSQAACEAAGGRWRAYDQPRPLSPSRPAPEEAATTSTTTTATSTVDGYCERDYECRSAYEDGQRAHDRVAFAILALLGLAIAVFGFFRSQHGILSISLSAAGVLLVLTSTIRFWNEANDWLQFGLLLIALIVFIYFGYRREQMD